MDGIRATFTQKFGPLPVWGWAAIALVALGGYLYLSHKGPFSGAAAPAASADKGNLSDLLGQYGARGGNPAAPDTAANPVYGPVISGYSGSVATSGSRGSTTTTAASEPVNVPTYSYQYGAPTARIAAKYPGANPSAGPTIGNYLAVQNQGLAIPAMSFPLLGRSSGPQGIA